MQTNKYTNSPMAYGRLLQNRGLNENILFGLNILWSESVDSAAYQEKVCLAFAEMYKVRIHNSIHV